MRIGGEIVREIFRETLLQQADALPSGVEFVKDAEAAKDMRADPSETGKSWASDVTKTHDKDHGHER